MSDERHDLGIPEEMRFPNGKAYVSPSEIALRARLRTLRDEMGAAATRDSGDAYGPLTYFQQRLALLVDPPTREEPP